MSVGYSYDIDLDALDGETDPRRVIQILQNTVTADSDFKIYPARQWMENFLYYSGARDFQARFGATTITNNSYLSMVSAQSGSLNAVTRRRISKTFKACQVQAANATRQKPSVKIWPESDDERSVKKAKLSNILVDYLWDVDYEDDMNYAAFLWALLTPAVARKDYLDFEFNKGRIWPVMQDSVDPMTGQPIKVPVVNANGEEVLEPYPWNKSELVSAFRLIFNPNATWMNDIDFIGDISVKRIGWLNQNFSRRDEGYYPNALNHVKKGSYTTTSCMALEDAIKQLTFGTYRSYRNFGDVAGHVKDGVLFGNFFFKPTPNYPEGREICFANDQIVYDGRSRVYHEEPTRWHPYSVMTYERVPGRLWGTTYAEKIVDINRAYEQSRTEFDQLRRTFSKPKLALPIGCQIETDTVTGEEQLWRYNPYGPDGGKPAYLNAPQPPTTIVDDIKLTDADFTYMSGTTEIALGIRPQGVTTFRGLEILREESNNAASNTIRMFEQFIQKGQQNKLDNLRICLRYPDKSLVNGIKIFKKMNQYVTDIDIKDFTGENLSGWVKIEPFSSIGKSKLSLQEKYISLAQMGVLGDVANDPDLNNEMKRKMDIMGFDRPENRQVTYARYENQLMLQAEEMGTIIDPPVQEWHDDILHIKEIEALLLDPTLQDKPLILQSLIAHRNDHLTQQAKKMNAAMAAQVNTPSSAAQKPGGGEAQAKDQTLFAPETGGSGQMEGVI